MTEQKRPLKTHSFNQFLTSNDTLWVMVGDEIVFTSDKDRLLPLLEYIDRFGHHHRPAAIFDKIMGNAAALLSVKADAQEVYSPLGSQVAVVTLENYGIGYHLNEIVPYIQRPGQEEMCPMEKLSLNKEPEEFYSEVRSLIHGS